MRSMMIACTAILLATAGASASGGLSCSTEAGPARIEIESGVTRGMGGPLFNFRATATIADKGVAEDLRKTSFEREHVPQYWLDGKELKLLLYREREGDKPHGYVEIEVRTQAGDDEGLYGGTYTLSTFDVPAGDGAEAKEFKAEGPISCFVE